MKNVCMILLVAGFVLSLATQSYAGNPNAEKYSDRVYSVAISGYEVVGYCVVNDANFKQNKQRFYKSFKGLRRPKKENVPGYAIEFAAVASWGKGLKGCGLLGEAYFYGPEVIEENQFYTVLFTGKVPFAYKVTGYCPKQKAAVKLLESAENQVTPQELKKDGWVHEDGKKYSYEFFVTFAQDAANVAQKQCDLDIVTIYQLEDTPLF